MDAGFDPPPTEVMLDAFVQYVGLVATFVPPPGVQRKRNPEDVEISRALTALRRILPEAVKRANSTEAAARSEFGKRSGALWLDACERRARHLRALQMAVKAASESFPPGPGKKVADWHRDAESVAGHIRAGLRQAGHKEPKFQRSQRTRNQGVATRPGRHRRFRATAHADRRGVPVPVGDCTSYSPTFVRVPILLTIATPAGCAQTGECKMATAIPDNPNALLTRTPWQQP